MKGKHNELNPHTHSAFLYLPTPLQMPSVTLLSCHPSSVSPLQTNDTLSLVLLFFQGVTLDPSSPAVCAIWRVHHHDRDLLSFVKRHMTTHPPHTTQCNCPGYNLAFHQKMCTVEIAQLWQHNRGNYTTPTIFSKKWRNLESPGSGSGYYHGY